MPEYYESGEIGEVIGFAIKKYITIKIPDVIKVQ